jgi:hypothetical protein
MYFPVLFFVSILHDASFAQQINYQCRVCPVGKYKSATSNNVCLNCPENTYQDILGATSPSQCKPYPANSFAPAGSGASTNCLCGRGYSGDVASYSHGPQNSNLQRSCGAGEANSCETLHSSIATLPASNAVDTDMGSFSISVRSLSGEALFFGLTRPWWRVKFEREAIVQRLEIYNSDPLKMSSFTVYVGNGANYAMMDQNAVCATNVMWPAGTPMLVVTCSQALQGQYLYIINGVDTNIHMSNVQVIGYLLPASEICVACAAGKYKDTTGTATCTNCLAGWASAAVAATSAATCTRCPKNTFAGVGSAACQGCPSDSSTVVEGSQSASFWNCNPGYSPAPSTRSCNAFQSLYQSKKPWAHYSADRWNAQTQILSDASGNNRNTLAVGNRAGITLQTGRDRGSPNDIPFLRGKTTDQLTFAENSIPQSFTICSVTRYAQTDRAQQRVLTANSPSWWHGHYLGKRGVASYASKRIMDAAGVVQIQPPVQNTNLDNTGTTGDWVVMCSKNGGDALLSVLVDGVGKGTSTRSDGDPNEWPGATAQVKIDNMEAGRNKNLCINCFKDQESEWDLAQLLIWDMHLSDSEMQTVSTELRRYSMPLTSECSLQPGEGCNACPPGTYKSSDENTPCINFVAGKYRVLTAATAESFCIACPANTFSFSRSTLATNCSCNAGYAAGVDGVACSACDAGSYKVNTGPGTCTKCGANEYSTTVAQVTSTCSSCPLNSAAPAGSNEATDCQCNVGYTGANGATCLSCVQGTYKPTVGPSPCTLCGNNTYSGVVAASSSVVCRACQDNSVSVMGSTRPSDCKCLLGYLTNNLGSENPTCQMCTAGSYNEKIDATTCSSCGPVMKSSTPGAVSKEACTECGTNTYSASGAAQCEICPINTFAPARSDELGDCKCLAGHKSVVIGEDGHACSACEAGKHKALTGSSPCIDCLADRYSTAIAATSVATCEYCTTNSVSPVGSSDPSQCVCDYGNALECITQAVTNIQYCECRYCKAGTFKNTLGSAACTNCPADHYSGLTAQRSNATCTPCYLNSVSPAGNDHIDDCSCSAGFEFL